jgi:Carbonic anhydrase
LRARAPRTTPSPLQLWRRHCHCAPSLPKLLLRPHLTAHQFTSPWLRRRRCTAAAAQNIIICGHYDCGGVKAAMRNHDHGIIEQWIMGIRDVARYHRKVQRTVEYARQSREDGVNLQISTQFCVWSVS